ncbi:hypothetical protein HW511_01495 [Asaia siamensis]|uniref:Uncharacterized protein n=1 Tax=Asaia siamensis TaxID=110479 RepID=A0ABQ1MKI4_9PROT|nr:hypothetical protein [Asaia siamensis]GBR07088.1 hypothetical protein AA0323_1666 [Asaia siamensis NRIC 0323]GGC42126.1 hypothetical protein GCM10007207_29280 [Asaia siamensis]
MSFKDLVNKSAAIYHNNEKNWFPDKKLIDDICNESSNFNFISFDVFDTAITRIVDSPVDVMAVVEKSLIDIFGAQARGFALARENAERSARHLAQKVGKIEVTFEDIYAELKKFISSNFAFEQKAKELEIEFELDICVPNFDMKTLFNSLREKNVSVLFISDMYHSADTIGRILEKCGYSDWQDILVSSELLHTKASGSLWSLIRHRFGENTRILHIGDDLAGDVNMPRAHGFNSIYYGRMRSERRVGADLTPDIVPFSILHRSAHLSSVGREKRFHEEWWHTLGASWGSLIVRAFVDWLAEKVQSEKIQHLYFCARDGYLIQKGWDIAEKYTPGPVTSSYLHVSRRPLNLAMGYCTSTPHKLSRELVEFYCKTYGNLTVNDVLERIELGEKERIFFKREAQSLFSSFNSTFSHDDAKKLAELLQRNASLIYYGLKNNYDSVIGYLDQEGLFSKTNAAIVDLGWAGTLQCSINQIIRHHGRKNLVSGFYYGLSDPSSGNHYRAGRMLSAFGCGFIPFDHQVHLRNGVDILETLHSARGGSVISYRKQGNTWLPLCTENTAELLQYDLVVAPFQKGVMEALEKWSTSESVGPLDSTYAMVPAAIAAMHSVFCSPSDEELKLLGSIKHCPTFEHHTYRSLINENVPADLDEMVARIRSAPWPVGTLKSWQDNNHAHREIFQKLAFALMSHLGERRLRQFQ